MFCVCELHTSHRVDEPLAVLLHGLALLLESGVRDPSAGRRGGADTCYARLVLDLLICKLSVYRALNLTRLLQELESSAVNVVPCLVERLGNARSSLRGS